MKTAPINVQNMTMEDGNGYRTDFNLYTLYPDMFIKDALVKFKTLLRDGYLQKARKDVCLNFHYINLYTSSSSLWALKRDQAGKDSTFIANKNTHITLNLRAGQSFAIFASLGATYYILPVQLLPYGTIADQGLYAY